MNLLKSEDAAAIIDAFQQNLAELDDEITALSTIRDIINTFISRSKAKTLCPPSLGMICCITLLMLCGTLPVHAKGIVSWYNRECRWRVSKKELFVIAKI
jgi:hypothetical protein